MMLRLKSCPRCRGDICIDRDVYGWYEKCIQCGYLGFLENMLGPDKQIAEDVKDSVVCLDDEFMEKADELNELAEAPIRKGQVTTSETAGGGYHGSTNQVKKGGVI